MRARCTDSCCRDHFTSLGLACRYFDEHGQWEFDNKKIAKHYLRGWFAIDLVSVVPFDLLGNVVGSDSLGQLKILRLIRLLRLIKLARVIRASRLFKRWEMSTDVSYSTLSMFKHFVVTTVATHWVRACHAARWCCADAT